MKTWVWIVIALLATLLVASGVHVYLVNQVPYDAMKSTKELFGFPTNVLTHIPYRGADARTVVRPSPDLIYSICIFDVSEYPVLFKAEVPDTYWSISGFAENTDNFFSINNQEHVKPGSAEIVVVREGVSYPDSENVHVVESPSDTGIILIRMFKPSQDMLQELMDVQRLATSELVGAQEEEKTGPLPPGEYSFEAEEYVNAEHGFTIKYPAEWPSGDPAGTELLRATAPAQVPVLTVSVREAATLTDAVNIGLTEAGGSEINVGTEKESELADGTGAFTVKVDWKTTAGHDGETFALGVQKDDNWIMVTITTVGLLFPYDEDMFSEIAHTLQLN